MGVSIALVEALYPAQAESPWLGRLGDSVVAVVFVLGSAASFAIGFKQNQFIASPAQLLSAAALSVLPMVSAFLIPAARSRVADRMVPSPWITSPWITGLVTLVLGMGVMYTPPQWGWVAVGALLAIDAVFLVLVTWVSRKTGWSRLQTLSLAAGGALAYGVHAFTGKPLVGGLLGMRISNAVFFVAAACLIGLAARRVIRCQTLDGPGSI
jgi:hypothetical protein